MGEPAREVTELLNAWTTGDLEARDQALALLYRELRRRAAVQLRREPHGHLLQPTALVHEAYLRIADQQGPWQNRVHFLAVASQMMRRILIDRARARLATKRSGRWARVTLSAAEDVAIWTESIDVLDLDAALHELASFDARKSRVAGMRFFGGLSAEEIGQVLGLSAKTVERDWQAARAWLFKTLTGRHGPRT